MPEVPYYDVVRSPEKRVAIDGVKYYEYLSESIYLQTIARLAAEIDPSGAVVLYNAKGGFVMAMAIYDIWKQKHSQLHLPYVVEYKSSAGESSGFVRVVEPITSKLVRDKKIILMDDVGDTNAATHKMVKDAKDSGASEIKTVVLVEKIPGLDQIPYKYDHVGVRTPRVWLAGWGMDPGDGYSLRESKILYVKA